MAGKVKIKKSKNLRFRLISVLYLLFISLTVLQIPIEWFRINYGLLDYLNKSTKSEINIPVLKECYDYVEDLDKRYLEALGGYNPSTGKYNEPNGYSVTDVFFFKPGTGDVLFDKLSKLNDFYLSKPSNDPKRIEFQKLFSLDLMNGLADGKKKIYLEWKFKHGPANVVRTFLGEMLLRFKLLNGGLEFQGEKGRNSIVMMAYNIESARPGDTVKIVVLDHDKMKVSATLNDKVFDLNKWKSDTLLFIPPTAGNYSLLFNKNGFEETLKISVIPKGFVGKSDHALQTFYEGKAAELRYVNLLNVGSASCNCDPTVKIDKSNGAVKFTPNSSGWCKFKMTSTDGFVLLNDSVYVQQIPAPFIVVDGASDRTISIGRLLNSKKLTFKAVHPDMPNFNYTIENMDVKLVGLKDGIKTISGGTIELSTDQLSQLQYVVVEKFSIQTQIKPIQFQEPLVIQIKR
jgi:hypothetical protein